MSRRAKFAIIAEEWLHRHSPSAAISTAEFWRGLCDAYPEMTAPSETRKTPRATCMRDVRKDPAFKVSDGKIALKGPTRTS